MFEKVGKIFCGIAKFLGILSIIDMALSVFGVVLGLLSMEEELFFIALITFISGLATLLFVSLPFYAIGQLVDDVHEIRKKIVEGSAQNAYMNAYQPVYQQPVYQQAQPVYQQPAQPTVSPMNPVSAPAGSEQTASL